MQHRRDVMKKEADEMNNATVKMHAIVKDYEKKIKTRDGRFGNSYAPETLRMAAFGGQIASTRLGGSTNRKSTMAAELPTATGLTKVSPDRITTIRQMRHFEDNQKRISQKQVQQAQLRMDLERQMQAKVFKRERERLYMDEKALVTSKGMLQEIGHTIPDKRPEEETMDLKLLEKEERFTNEEVRALQRIAHEM